MAYDDVFNLQRKLCWRCEEHFWRIWHCNNLHLGTCYDCWPSMHSAADRWSFVVTPPGDTIPVEYFCCESSCCCVLIPIIFQVSISRTQTPHKHLFSWHSIHCSLHGRNCKLPIMAFQNAIYYNFTGTILIDSVGSCVYRTIFVAIQEEDLSHFCMLIMTNIPHSLPPLNQRSARLLIFHWTAHFDSINTCKLH